MHDLGGTHGFGPVEIEADEPVFHAQWERRVLGIQLQMLARGIPKNLDEARKDVEGLEPAVYLTESYYGRWLLAAERRVVRRGVLTQEELVSRQRQLRAQPSARLPSNPDEGFASRLLGRLAAGRGTSREVERAPRYSEGDRIATRNVHSRAHTRLPRYVRGRRGVIERVYGAFDLPELAATGGEQPEHVYAVRFEAEELWGESAQPNSSVCVDLWESYLLPAEEAGSQ